MSNIPNQPSTGILTASGGLSLDWRLWFMQLTNKTNDVKRSVETLTASDSGSLDFYKNIDIADVVYEIDIVNLTLNTLNSTLLLQCSTDSGVTYMSTISDYEWSRVNNGSSTTNTSDYAISLLPSTVNNVDGSEIQGTIRISTPLASTQYKMIHWYLVFKDSSSIMQVVQGVAQVKTLSPINGFKLKNSAGLIKSGVCKVYSLQ